MRSCDFLISWGVGFVVLGAVATGCDRNTDQEVVSSPPRSCITPGVGLGIFEIGASAEALKRVKPPTSIIKDVDLRPGEYLIYEDEGIEVKSENDRIVLIGIDVSRTMGERGTCKGTNSASTIRDVIITYGQPSVLANLTVHSDKDTPPKQKVELRYYEKGIDFTFWDGRLGQITVHKPMKEGEYDLVWIRDTGDVSEYRSIEVPSETGEHNGDVADD